MATKSLSILGKTAVGNVRLPMKPGRAGTMTHDYKRDDHAVRRSERSRGCGSEARRAQDGLNTHSLRKLNALRHTCQLKFQTG